MKPMSVVKSKRGQGVLTKQDVDKCFESWKSHAVKGNSYNLINSMTNYYNNLWRDKT